MFSTVRERVRPSAGSDHRLVQRPCEARFLGLEIGASQSTRPVGAERFRRTPHIALSGAFLALHASVCNRWPRRWVSGTTARVAPGKNLPDSGVTSEPVGCYATPAQLGGSSGICRTTRPVTCYEEAHSPCECSLLTLINRRPPRLVRGTHAHFRARPRPRRRDVETGALADCGMRNAECGVVLPGLRPNPSGDCSHVENRPAPHAHPAARKLISLLNPKGAASQPHTEGRESCLLYWSLAAMRRGIHAGLMQFKPMVVSWAIVVACLWLEVGHADDRIWMHAEINGKRARLDFDTGASGLGLWPATAERFGLKFTVPPTNSPRARICF